MLILFFILGLISMSLIFPMLEGLVSLFLQWLETKKAKLIAEQLALVGEQPQEEEYHAPAIGFQVDYESEDEEPDED